MSGFKIFQSRVFLASLLSASMAMALAACGDGSPVATSPVIRESAPASGTESEVMSIESEIRLAAASGRIFATDTTTLEIFDVALALAINRLPSGDLAAVVTRANTIAGSSIALEAVQTRINNVLGAGAGITELRASFASATTTGEAGVVAIEDVAVLLAIARLPASATSAQIATRANSVLGRTGAPNAITADEVNATPAQPVSTPTPAASPSPGASPVASPSPGASPVASPSPGASPVASPSPGASPVASPSPGASPVASPSPEPSAAPSPEVSPTPTGPVTYFVSPAGTGDGLSDTTPTTLADALDQAAPDDTIRLAAGTYPDNLELTVANLTLEGAGIGQTIIVPPTTTPCTGISISAANLSLSGFTVDGANIGGGSCTDAALIRANNAATDLAIDDVALQGTNPTPTTGSVVLPLDAAAHGIAIDGVSDITLANLEATNVNNSAVLITNASGRVVVQDSTFTNSGSRALFIQNSNGTVSVLNNEVNGALNEGLYLRDVTGTASITDNTVQDIRYKPTLAGGSGIEGGIVHTNTLGTVNTTISGNIVNIDPTGQTLGFTGELLLDIDGIEANTFGTAIGTAVVSGNTVRNTDDDGIDSDTAGTAQLDITISNNTLENIQDRSISFVSAESGQVTGRLLSNTIAGPSVLNPSPDVDADGIGIRPRGGSIMRILVQGNTVTNPGRKGIDINMNRGDGDAGPVNNATAFFRFDGNTVTNAGQRAYDVQLEDTSNATGVLVNNIVNGAASDGIRVRSGAGDGAETNVLRVGLFKNTVTSAGGAADGGIFVRAQNESRLCVSLVDNRSDSSAGADGGALQDYFLRSQNSSVLELFGITTAIAAANPSVPLRDALVAQDNTGRDATFPARVQNNDVQVPTGDCTFPVVTFDPLVP